MTVVLGKRFSLYVNSKRNSNTKLLGRKRKWQVRSAAPTKVAIALWLLIYYND